MRSEEGDPPFPATLLSAKACLCHPPSFHDDPPSPRRPCPDRRPLAAQRDWLLRRLFVLQSSSWSPDCISAADGVIAKARWPGSTHWRMLQIELPPLLLRQCQTPPFFLSSGGCPLWPPNLPFILMRMPSGFWGWDGERVHVTKKRPRAPAKGNFTDRRASTRPSWLASRQRPPRPSGATTARTCFAGIGGDEADEVSEAATAWPRSPATSSTTNRAKGRP
jgi:hypothetical protein